MLSPLNGPAETPQPASSGSNNNSEILKDSFGNSLWAALNDQDGKVDENDIVYRDGAKKSEKITNFLKAHIGESWEGLKKEVQSLLTRYNMEQSMNADSNSFDDMAADYEQFKNNMKSNFDETKARNEAEYKAFQDDAESKKLNFEADSKYLTTEFKKDCMMKILNDLKSGAKGNLTIVSYGTITWSPENDCFMLTKYNGESKQIPNDKLEEKLQVIAESKLNVTGYSRFEKVE